MAEENKEISIDDKREQRAHDWRMAVISAGAIVLSVTIVMVGLLMYNAMSEAKEVRIKQIDIDGDIQKKRMEAGSCGCSPSEKVLCMPSTR